MVATSRLAALSSQLAMAAAFVSPRSTPQVALPDKIISGYANWGQCDEQLVQACADGVNVLIWFSINLAYDDDAGAPIMTGPATGAAYYDCVASIVRQIRHQVDHDVLHLVSIGGWNSPHPRTELTGAQWWDFFKQWNEQQVARPADGWEGFAGFDWDLEGNDDPESPNNLFSVQVLDIMGVMATLAKADGYIVAMAPAQSYLDPFGGPEYSRAVNFNPGFGDWQEDFTFHGRNTYAYVLAKYGADIFDFISIQLYEGWSGANYQVTEGGTSASKYLQGIVRASVAGWEVHFESDPTVGLPSQTVSVAGSQLVIGLGNGWCAPPGPDSKFMLIWPEEVGEAWHALSSVGEAPRGFMFWTIAEEGATPPGTQRPLFFTRELVAALEAPT